MISPRARLLLLFGLPALGLVAALWGYFQVVPAGLRLRSFEPYFFASRDLGTFSSPEGAHAVRIIVNDAGAAHAGNHWAWVLRAAPVVGQQIVAEGYVDFLQSKRETFPLRWVSENQIALTFRKGRHSGGQITRIYPLP
jgi:hypothetical protein